MDMNYLQISRGDLWQNAHKICEYIGVPVIGVVKCDGYGVGILEAARAWQQAGVKLFAVSKPSEALALREAGFREDILLLSPVADPEILNTLVRHKVILTVTGLENAEFYSLCASALPVRVHVAVDTGMGRFGVRWTDLDQLKGIYNLKGFQIEGIFSHFSSSFEKKERLTRRQLDRFLAVTDALKAAGYETGIRHIANSCAALRFPHTRLDAVRIGSALVGKLCAEVPIRLQCVGAFYARVVDCKCFHPGDTTGYASACKVRRYVRAVAVAVGKDDGFGYLESPGTFGIRAMACYLRNLLLRCLRRPYVEFYGKKLYLIGRIGQQYTLFDAAGENIRPGDTVRVHVPLLFPGRTRHFHCAEHPQAHCHTDKKYPEERSGDKSPGYGNTGDFPSASLAQDDKNACYAR